MTKSPSSILRTTACLAALLSVTACGTIKDIANIGKEPAMAHIESPYNQPGYKPVALPMPPLEAQNQQANSLWQASRQTFFKDQRAHKVGDILTIAIDINDTADLKNKTERARSGKENDGLANFLGLENQMNRLLPGTVDPTKLIGMDASSSSSGDGKIQRGEAIKLKLAAMVMQVLSNGNFVIQGRQQVRVNYELRDLQLQGVIRPEDILNNNSISYEKIAEARISYGGKGNVSELQQERYGQQLFEKLLPF